MAVRHSASLSPLWACLARNAGASDDEGAGPRAFRGERTARRSLLLGLLKVYAATEEAPRLANAEAVYSDCTLLIGHVDHRARHGREKGSLARAAEGSTQEACEAAVAVRRRGAIRRNRWRSR